jgi:hypothetical protein
MKPRHACTLAVAAILLVAAPASAGRFEEFTAKAAQGEKLKTVAATYFGGPGIEEFVAAEGLPDGSIVAFGNAWGPEFPAEPAPVVLGKGERYAIADTRVDKKGKKEVPANNPNIAGMIVRYAAGLKKVEQVVRFDWGVAAISAGTVAPDGGLVIAGRCTPHFADLAKQAAASAIDPLTIPEDARKDLGPTEYEGVKLPGDVYVAKLAPDAKSFLWVHVLQGHRTPPARLFLDDKGNVTFECVTISRISADGKELKALTGRQTGGDRSKLLAVNPKDGTFLYGGDYNTKTGREPWRDPFLDAYDAAGTKLWRLWGLDPKLIGSDKYRLVADSAARAATFSPQGDIVLAGWSDGGNSVFTRKVKDLDATFKAPGVGMTSWGMRGANSIAWLMRFDTKDFEFQAQTVWVAYLPQGGDKGGAPNFARVNQVLMMPDESVAFRGAAATALVQTPGAWFKPPADGTGYGGDYVAVFSKDLTDLRFSSLVPGCKVQGIGLTKGGLVVASRSDGKEQSGNAPPLVAPAQAEFGGKYDGHLILLEAPAAKPPAGANPPSTP